MWEEKVWGRVWHLFANDQASVSFLELKKGYQCSRHYHERRVNFFAVISGIIMVQLFDGDGRLLTEQELGPGETTAVPSRHLHRFKVLESGQVVEVYWPDAKVEQTDIVRLDEGGPME